MNTSRRFVGTTLTFVHFSLLGALAHAQGSVSRVSLPNTVGEGSAGSDACSLSSDGRLVAFESSASNLVAGDTNGKVDVFVRDRVAGTTRRVSVSTAGVQANQDAFGARISGDGQFVFFVSVASNLVVGDTNGTLDVFAYKLATGATTRVSVASNGTQVTSHCWLGNCSANGRLVVFTSESSSLVSGDSNGCSDVFVRDRTTATTTLASLASSGSQGDAQSDEPSISLDGRFVVFSSGASNLVANDANNANDIFVRDLTAGTTELVTLDSQGAQANSQSWQPAISGDGRYVAFVSTATNLVIGDNNAHLDVFVRDRLNATTVRASVGNLGLEGNDESTHPCISGNGRFVVFESLASNLIANDGNNAADVFAFDLASPTTWRISESTLGAEADAFSGRPSVNATGDAIAFTSWATTLANDDGNAINDIYAYDSLPSTPPTFCTAGTSAGGCVAQISASAQPRASGGGACQITVQGVEGQRSGIIFYGVDNSGFSPLAWGTGSSLLCVKSPIQRTNVQASGGTLFTCNGVLQLDWNAYQASHPAALGAPWSIGSPAFAQAWYRDPASPKTTSLSDALQLTYLP